MKTLMLLRHAKSDWDDAALRDFDRPLAERGKRDAPRMGKALAARGPVPDLIISSPAARAKATTEAFIQAGGFTAPLRFNQNIYDASTAELMRLIRHLPDEYACILLTGHNPAFEDGLARLTGVLERMPTAALACVEFQIDRWEDVEDRKGKLVWLLTPKQLPAEKHN